MINKNVKIMGDIIRTGDFTLLQNLQTENINYNTIKSQINNNENFRNISKSIKRIFDQIMPGESSTKSKFCFLFSLSVFEVENGDDQKKELFKIEKLTQKTPFLDNTKKKIYLLRYLTNSLAFKNAFAANEITPFINLYKQFI